MRLKNKREVENYIYKERERERNHAIVVKFNFTMLSLRIYL